MRTTPNSSSCCWDLSLPSVSGWACFALCDEIWESHRQTLKTLFARWSQHWTGCVIRFSVVTYPSECLLYVLQACISIYYVSDPINVSSSPAPYMTLPRPTCFMRYAQYFVVRRAVSFFALFWAVLLPICLEVPEGTQRFGRHGVEYCNERAAVRDNVESPKSAAPHSAQHTESWDKRGRCLRCDGCWMFILPRKLEMLHSDYPFIVIKFDPV